MTRGLTGIWMREGLMEDVIKVWDQLSYLIGTFIRPIGSLVFGAVIGWLTASTFMDAEKEWQLKIAIFLGMLGAFICLHIYSGPGTTGLFALGAGATAIFLVLKANQPAKKK
jgi:uncharacterized membrane protein YeaQ/YmgE (transglycosylase-associated protein family)